MVNFPDSGFNTTLQEAARHVSMEKESQISEVELRGIFEVKRRLEDLAKKDDDLRGGLIVPGPKVDLGPVYHPLVEEFEDKHNRKMTFDEAQWIRAQAAAEIFKEVDQVTNPLLEEAIKYLDQQTGLWRHKFTTVFDHNRHEAKAFMDSIYYTTPTGISLRLKRANARQGGLRKVIQPPFERIVFLRPVDMLRMAKPPEDISFEPQLGWHVQEYSSDAFYQLQSDAVAQGDFLSNLSFPIRQDEHDKNLIQLPDVQHEHTGDQVNYIFF